MALWDLDISVCGVSLGKYKLVFVLNDLIKTNTTSYIALVSSWVGEMPQTHHAF